MTAQSGQSLRPHLVLASASARRKALLEQIGIVPARIVPARIDEVPIPGELPRAHALRLAREKALHVTQTSGGGSPSFVLAGDTVVACGRRILPKPEDEGEARGCLDLLSGRRHRVFTGLCAVAPDGRAATRVAETVVSFKVLSDEEKAAYLACGEWRGKAGGYAVQGRAAAFVRSLNGSYSNVVGLPLYETAQMLRGLGFPLWQDESS